MQQYFRIYMYSRSVLHKFRTRCDFCNVSSRTQICKITWTSHDKRLCAADNRAQIEFVFFLFFLFLYFHFLFLFFSSFFPFFSGFFLLCFVIVLLLSSPSSLILFFSSTFYSCSSPFTSSSMLLFFFFLFFSLSPSSYSLMTFSTIN